MAREHDELVPVANRLTSDTPLGRFLRRIAEFYRDRPTAQIAASFLPYAGGIRAGFQAIVPSVVETRLQEFIEASDASFGALEARVSGLELAATEESADWLLSGLQTAARARTRGARRRVGWVTAGQLANPLPWDRAHTLLEIAGTLSDVEFEIARLGVERTTSPAGPFSDPVLVLGDISRIAFPKALHLPSMFEAAGIGELRLICARLVALGLLADSGVGRVGTPSMDQFATTQASRWLVEMIERAEPGTKT